MMRRLKKWWEERHKRKSDDDLRFENGELSKQIRSQSSKISTLEDKIENLTKTVKLLEVEKVVLEKERDLMTLVIERDRARVIAESQIGTEE